MPTDFSHWIESLTSSDGFLHISAVRPYAHDEEKYDAQYGVHTPRPEEGLGLVALLKKSQADLQGPALEIGCGTGHLTTGLAMGYPGSAVVITDPSISFLRLTRDRLQPASGGRAPQYYAVLNGDDLGLLPPETFSLITLRSTLHHVLNVESFIAAAARSLRPGGSLAMSAEPCESGYVLMGAVAHSIPSIFQCAGIQMQPEWDKQLRLFCDTMKFYCRRDLDKAAAEDKHLFRVHELAALGARHGLDLEYFPNAAYSDFAPSAPASKPPVRFETFFLSYLRYCMSFSPEFVEAIGLHLKPQFAYLDQCYSGHPGPLFTGVFILHKKPSSHRAG